MGLFGGGGSKSSTTNNTNQTTTNTQTVNTSTVGLDNVETGVVGSNNTITSVSTDHGAVEAGTRLGESALDTVGETVEGAFGVARESLGTVERGLDAALDFGSGITADAFAFGARALDANRESAEVTARTLAGAIDQAAQATRSDSADTLQKLGKFGTVAVVAVVLGGVALFVFGRRK